MSYKSYVTTESINIEYYIIQVEYNSVLGYTNLSWWLERGCDLRSKKSRSLPIKPDRYEIHLRSISLNLFKMNLVKYVVLEKHLSQRCQ